MTSPAYTKEIEPVLKVLANRRRLHILSLLKKRGEMSVGDIADALGLSVRSTSRHLQNLKNAHLVANHQENTVVFYSIAPHSSKIVQVITQQL